MSFKSLEEDETRFNGSPELLEGREEGEGESKPLIVGDKTPGEDESATPASEGWRVAVDPAQ